MDAAEQLGQPAPGQGLAVDQGGGAAHLLGGHQPPIGSSSATSSQPSGTARSRSTRPERANGDGLSTATAPLGTRAATSAATRSASPDPSWAASPSRTATWSATASAPQPVIESCPEDSTSRRQPSSRNASGQPVPCSACSGSA